MSNNGVFGPNNSALCSSKRESPRDKPVVSSEFHTASAFGGIRAGVQSPFRHQSTNVGLLGVPRGALSSLIHQLVDLRLEHFLLGEAYMPETYSTLFVDQYRHRE